MDNNLDNKRVVVNLHQSESGKPAEGKVEVIEKKHYHILEKNVTTCFETDHMESFKSYCDKVDDNASVYYTEDSVVLHKDEPGIHDDSPVAICEIGLTNLSHDLLHCVHSRIKSSKEFETFLRKYKPYLDTNGHDLLKMTQNFTISKTEKIEKTKDNKGNFAFAVSRKKGGKEDVEFPDRITITVPLLKGEDVKIVVPFDFEFDYKTDENEVIMKFVLYNYELKELYDESTRAYLKEKLDSFGVPVYWGTKNVRVKDDKWKYKKAE